MFHNYYVYIVTNKTNRVLYTGITNSLVKRIYEHKHHLFNGFTKRYRVNKLIYYEHILNVYSAIQREKQIKGWKREKKIALIEKMNPNWEELPVE